MSYHITQRDAEFFIAAEHKQPALEALKENVRLCPGLMWVDSSQVLNSNSLEEALAHIRYRAKTDPEYNIVDIQFIGENLGDDKLIFGFIAFLSKKTASLK
jgi:hypothetical protein